MAATDPNAPQLPSFAVTLLQSAGQHAGTALAALLASWGVAQTSQQAQIVSFVSSGVILAASLAWTYVMHRLHKDTAVAVATNAAVTGVLPKAP